MKVIRARNVHQALPEALYQLAAEGIDRESRNGPVVMFPEPVTTVYEEPAERVLFWPSRDANPFFHLMEALWMLGGRNDVEFVARFVERMRSFSDDGVTFHGAYGHRWRVHFERDQLPGIIEALKENPEDRRQVLSMWDARVDLGRKGKDLPCNLQALFQIDGDGKLVMMVTNRSNDIVWGAYGANAVHFSYLHEYVARSVGVPQGRYYQVSGNFHAYREVLGQVANLVDCAPDPVLPEEARWAGLCPYIDARVEPFPLMSTDRKTWDADLEMFLDEGPVMGFRDPFFRRVAVPMMEAHRVYKETKGAEKYDAAIAVLEDCAASDWHLAAVEWIDRRREAYEERLKRAQDDGVAYE